MNRKLLVLLLALLPAFVFAQQNTQAKFALVIGNGNYTNLSKLANPVNDANDMADALREIGFTVDKLLNAGQDQMETAVMRLKDRLSASSGSYGFLFYAGHGVQSGGENYLIPVDANIPGENFLRSRAVSVQLLLDELNDARNGLNVVVLDACRDNPFGWGRGGGRGLAIVSKQPADSIIVYATSAGQQASDGTGRNGLFTSQLLKNIKTPGLEVNEMFRMTGADVSEASSRRQIPAIYSQFFKVAYLGAPPKAAPPVGVFEAGAVSTAMGRLEISTITAGTLRISGSTVNQTVQLPEWGSLPIEKINAGTYKITMNYDNGKSEERTIVVGRSETAKLDFTYSPPLPVQPKPKPAPVPKEPKPIPPPKEPKPAPPPKEPKPAPAPKEPKPAPAPKEPAPKEAKEQKFVDADTKLWSVGASLGTTFAAPLLVGTVQGTVAPFKWTFFDLGMDLGFLSGSAEVGYFSVYPFAHYAFFMPFANAANGKGGGWYAGLGAGCLMPKYTFPDGEAKDSIFAADFTAGLVLGNGISVSYSFRTDFATASNKLAVGYLYRFR